MRSILPIKADSHPYADLGIIRCERNTRCRRLPAMTTPDQKLELSHSQAPRWRSTGRAWAGSPRSERPDIEQTADARRCAQPGRMAPAKSERTIIKSPIWVNSAIRPPLPGYALRSL
jgi:hypothetical protein